MSKMLKSEAVILRLREKVKCLDKLPTFIWRATLLFLQMFAEFYFMSNPKRRGQLLSNLYGSPMHYL